MLFVDHDRSVNWCVEKNKVDISKVKGGSKEKFWFNCEKCRHLFEMSPNKIVYSNQWCPYCSIPCRKLCGKEDCKICFEKSFASHPKSKFWSIKNSFSPIEISKNSHNCLLECFQIFIRGIQ